MITDKTVVFYKDSYDTIYIVDKIDYVNASDIEYKTTILTPRILSEPEKVRIQGNILFKYGSVEIRREVYRLSGPVGQLINLDTFTSNTPLNQSIDTGKSVIVRNYYNGNLTSVPATITSIMDDLVTVKLAYQNTPNMPLLGAAHISFDNQYELLTSGVYYGEDYIRITYSCYDAQERCGSVVVSSDAFRFGPRDNFRWHLDNAISDTISIEVSDGSAFIDVGMYDGSETGTFGSATVWGIVAPNGSVSAGPYSTLLTWINVWGS